MDETRGKIAALTIKLQRQRQLPLWALADENLIYATASNEKPTWGAKTNLVLKIMEIANTVKFTDFIIVSVGLYQIITLYNQTKKYRQSKSTHLTDFTRVFAGFGSSNEAYLFQNYKERFQESTLRINWATQEGVLRLGTLKLSTLFIMLLKNVWGYSKKFNQLFPDIKHYRNEFLTVCALNSGTYTFYQLYWKLAKRNKIKEAAFIAPSMAAFAAINQNISTRFLQHGLMAQSILIPQFDIIEAVTADESIYFKTLHPDIKLINTHGNIKSLDSHQPVAMILSPNTFNLSIGENIEPMLCFFQYAKELGINMILRPTRQVSEKERLDLAFQFPGALFDDSNRPLHLSYEKWKPQLVLSWRSTGLATALQYGCLPISFFAPETNNKTWDMIYPMKNRVLFWPRDKYLIQEAIKSPTAHSIQIKRLRGAIISDQMVTADSRIAAT